MKGLTKSTYCLLLILILLTTACVNSHKYPGYKKSLNGIIFKLIEIGYTEKKANIGDYITADITYKTLNDSVFFNGRRKILIEKPDYKGSIDKCFTYLSEGDRMEFILDAKKFFEISLQGEVPDFIDHESTDIKVDIKAINIQTQREYEKEKEAFLSWVNSFEDYEKTILQQYFKEEKLNISPANSGIYKVTRSEGTGNLVEVGDTVIVDYEGKFLNGKYFDSTIKRKEAFGFVYGTEWQVIPGMEKAIGTMKEGEKAIFIIPSDMAWGKTGSSTGIIPPYTSVIFEVKLVEIRKGKSSLTTSNK